jgi:hypothetical protein
VSLATRLARPQPSAVFVGLIVIGAAIGGAFAGCHPTGTAGVDEVETALFAGGFSLVPSRSARGTWLLVGFMGVALARGWLLVPAAVTVAIAFASVWSRRRWDVIGAVVGGLGVQVMLRWPPHLFHGFPSAVAGLVLLICAFSGWVGSSKSTRRIAGWIVTGLGVLAVILSIPVAVALLLVRGDVSAGQAATKAAIQGIGNGQSTLVTNELRTAVADTSHASGIVGAWYTAVARVVPVVSQQGRFVTGTIEAAESATRVGLAEAPAVNYHQLEYHGGRMNLPRVSAMAEPLQLVDRTLHAAETEFSDVHSQWLIGPLESRGRSLGAEVDRSTHSADLALYAARLLPALLGGDGERRYFVAFTSPSESRGYGGFVGSYGVLTADSGHVSLTESGQPTDLEAMLPKGGATLRGVSGFLARYGRFHPGEFVRDATYSPNLPTVASVLAQEYVQAGGAPVDGVLVIDPYGLAALLHFTGPIAVPGLPFPLTSQNAANVLLKEQYTTFDKGESDADAIRHDFLQTTLHLAFSDLVNGNLPSPQALSEVLAPAVAQGRISFWTFNKVEQPFIRALGLSGAFPEAGGKDLLAITTQNVDQNKIDAFLHKQVSDRVSFDPGTGAVTSTVTVRLTNDAPGSGLPDIVIATPGYPSLHPGTNRTWLSLYTPLAFERVTLDGRRQTMTTGRELGVNAYSTFVDIPPRTTVSLVVQLAGSVLPGNYRLSVRLQPSSNGQRNQVEVIPTAGWQVAGGPLEAIWRLDQDMRQVRSFSFSRS